MRILHTADWHLGRTFHGASLIDAQTAVLDQLVDATASERPDAVVISGDVFDRAYPPLDVVALYDDVTARLAQSGVPIVLISGNHDSPIRLGMHASLAAAAGVHVRTRVAGIADPVQIPLASGGSGLIYAIPYLDPTTCAPLLDAEATHQSVIAAAVAKLRADRAKRGPAPTVVLAHGVVTGGRLLAGGPDAGAERSIDVGGSSVVDGTTFDGIDYVALGHLHCPQQIGPRLRYSGAPVPFGFDEAGDQKSISLVDLSGSEPQVEFLPTPVFRPIARITGTLEELIEGREFAADEQAWVQATLTDRLRPSQAMDQLRRRFPHILSVLHAPTGVAPTSGNAATYEARVRGRAPLEIAEQFIGDVRRGVDASELERELLREALEHGSREVTQ